MTNYSPPLILDKNNSVPMKQQPIFEIIDFVKQTTVAINTISESTKSLEQTTGALKEMISSQNTTNGKSFEGLTGDNKVLGGKMDTIKTILVAVVLPLIGGILSLVGVKMFFKLP